MSQNDPMSESGGAKDNQIKAQSDNLVEQAMLHPFDSIDALLEWVAKPTPESVKSPVQDSHPSIFISP